MTITVEVIGSIPTPNNHEIRKLICNDAHLRLISEQAHDREQIESTKAKPGHDALATARKSATQAANQSL